MYVDPMVSLIQYARAKPDNSNAMPTSIETIAPVANAKSNLVALSAAVKLACSFCIWT
jgi:hypothetical protein